MASPTQRRIASLVLTFSLVLVILTSLVLYYVPEGRVAYWADWRLLGLTKSDWGSVHITTGFLFIAAGLWHVVLNLRPLGGYFKVTTPVVVSLVLTLFVTVGTLMGLPPMQQVLDLGEHFKESHQVTYGNPPFGHAELATVQKLCGFTGLDATAALAELKAAGITGATLQTTIVEIARANDRTPKEIYAIIQRSRSASSAQDGLSGLPPTPPQGTGKMRLTDLAANYGADMNTMLEALNKAGYTATAEMTMKEIASSNNATPADVYTVLITTE